MPPVGGLSVLGNGPQLVESMTKRELFAAMAMQGYLSGRSADSPSSMRPEAVAVGCVLYADALLAELAQ